MVDFNRSSEGALNKNTERGTILILLFVFAGLGTVSNAEQKKPFGSTMT